MKVINGSARETHRSAVPLEHCKTPAIPESLGMKRTATSDMPAAHAGDILLLPIAAVALWTLAYQLVLIVRWPAGMITWCFLVAVGLASFLLRRLWKQTDYIPGKGYRFHLAHLFLLVLGLAYAITALFVRRPNQDDVVYMHRVLTQLLDLGQPIYLRQTSVDMDAAAFSPVHLATSYEMFMGFLGHYLRIDPLYFYQVIGHVIAAFSVPFVYYWCTRVFGLRRWTASIGALFGIGFLLLADESSFGALLGAGFPLVAGQSLSAVNTRGMLGFATVSGYLWQGKPIVWIVLAPIALALTYRYLDRGNRADLVWLAFLGIAGVGVSNTAIYLIPAVIGCAWLAYFAVGRFERRGRAEFLTQIRRGLLLAIPVAYPVGILLLLAIKVIPQPIDTRMYGPSYMPWREAVDYVIGGRGDYLRDVVIMLAVPLLIVRGRQGLFLFFYLAAVWLLCLNPILAPFWMKSILAYCYFRLVYLLPLPLLCALLAAAGPRLMDNRRLLTERLTTALGFAAVVVTFPFSYHGISILPRDPKLGIGWKSPSEDQLLPSNLAFAKAAGPYIAHAKLLAPNWTASCELPLLFPTMKIVAPRLVLHYFSNAGNPEEGVLRGQAQAFVESPILRSPKQFKSFEPKFRTVIETGRANAVATPESESDRVLAVLKSINPAWRRVLTAGGLVLMLPSDAGPQGGAQVRMWRSAGAMRHVADTNKFTYQSGFSLTE
jgi:hypothetical protein